MAGKAYVTVSLDKKGSVVRVMQGGRVIRRKKGRPGPSKRGGSSAGCDSIIAVLVHELLTCKPTPPKDSDDKGGGTGKGGGTNTGTDPCCFRDGATGDEWCWC